MRNAFAAIKLIEPFLHGRHNFLPNFFEQYLAYTIEKLRAAGAVPEEISRQMQENEKFLRWYQNPVIRYAPCLENRRAAPSVCRTAPWGIRFTSLGGTACRAFAVLRHACH